MEQIKNNQEHTNFGGVIEKAGKTKAKMTRSLLNNMSMIIGAFIVFVVIVVFTTNITISNDIETVELGLTFFILLFCSYSMYVNFVGSGTQQGKETKIYIDTYNKYENLKDIIISKKQQDRIGEFCNYYIKEELKTTRTAILSEVGLDYDEYLKFYLGKDDEYLLNCKELSTSQFEAIRKANSIKPVELVPEMILKRGRGSRRRSPLGVKPQTRKIVHYITKFISTSITSLFTVAMICQVVIDPSWATFATCCLKILLVVLNGFFGYKMGYENVTIYTVDYMNDQIDLIQQFEQYITDNPKPMKIEIREQEQPEDITENIEKEITTENGDKNPSSEYLPVEQLKIATNNENL